MGLDMLLLPFPRLYRPFCFQNLPARSAVINKAAGFFPTYLLVWVRVRSLGQCASHGRSRLRQVLVEAGAAGQESCSLAAVGCRWAT